MNIGNARKVFTFLTISGKALAFSEKLIIGMYFVHYLAFFHMSEPGFPPPDPWADAHRGFLASF
jgi:hypothetical protein